MDDDRWHCVQSQEIPKIYSKTAKSKVKSLDQACKKGAFRDYKFNFKLRKLDSKSTSTKLNPSLKWLK